MPARASPQVARPLPVDAVVTGEFDAAFAVLRPPGHHATAGRAMGFCLYNNVAVAVEHARAERASRRVAIVDIDVHHGNGSEATFWNDPAVLYTSLHQSPFYPGTGRAGGSRRPAGAGLTVNVPLPAGTSAQSWLAAFDDIVIRCAARPSNPSWWWSAAASTPTATTPSPSCCSRQHTYAAVAERLCSLRALRSAPRTAWILEGGYDLDALAASTQAVLEVLAARERGALRSCGHADTLDLSPRSPRSLLAACGAGGIADRGGHQPARARAVERRGKPTRRRRARPGCGLC